MAPIKKQEIKKIVLAYSGGLDTSIILKWLKNEYGCKVVAFSADLGQGDELDPVREKALATGADKVYIDDLQAPAAGLPRPPGFGLPACWSVVAAERRRFELCCPGADFS